MEVRETFEIARNHLRAPYATRQQHGCQALVQQLDELVHVGLPIFIGGVMRSTLPYMPPLPISRPFSRVASMQLRGLRGGRRLRLAILHQFDRLHQAHAAHVADELVLLLQFLQASRAGKRRPRRIGHQVLLFDEIDHRLGRGGGHRIAAEGGDGHALHARRRPPASPP